MRILFLILLIFTFFVDLAKGVETVIAIKLNNNSPIQYCTTPVIVAGNLSIEGTFAITGMKISFSQGFVSGEDELVYSNAIATIQANWSAQQGYLLLQPNGTSAPTKEDYRDAIKSVTYKNNNPTPTIGIRKISVTLDDADYLDETKHFYQYISKSGITWTAARNETAGTLYHGLLRGYLATITSKAENEFINFKTQGIGWIGASDYAVEGEWRWVTGPEGLEEGLKGRLFWKGTGGQAKSDPANYGSVNGGYQNWNRWDDNPTGDQMQYEPNDYNQTNKDHEEDYAHITANKKWNDYPNDGGSSGYLIEFGGMPGDPEVNLSATLDLQVNTMLFYKSGIQPAVCEGTTVELNQPDLNIIPASYAWIPDETLSATDIANPVATPKFPSTSLHCYRNQGNLSIGYSII